jgi:PPOX class probable F420-dependent enzyme
MILSDEQRVFAESHRVAHLATADATGTPHVVPLCYAVVGDSLYFVIDDKPKPTRHALKRLRNIRENPRVAVVVDDYDEDWSRLAFLLVQGDAQLVADAQEYAVALEQLRNRYAQYRTMPLRQDTHPIVRIIPTRIHLWRATPAR